MLHARLFNAADVRGGSLMGGHVRPHYRRFGAAGACVPAALLAFIVSAVSVAAQQVDNMNGQPQLPRVDTIDLTDVPGVPIAQGTNAQPVGLYGVTTYRIEQLTLPQAVTVVVGGQAVTANLAWRIVISGGPFVVRDIPATIWIDDTDLGYGQESVDLSAISVLTFDPTLLRDGARLAVSYIGDMDRFELPERVRLVGGMP